MKKILTLVLLLSLCISLFSCSPQSQPDPKESETDENTQNMPANNPIDPGYIQNDGGGKTTDFVYLLVDGKPVSGENYWRTVRLFSKQADGTITESEVEENASPLLNFKNTDQVGQITCSKAEFEEKVKVVTNFVEGQDGFTFGGDFYSELSRGYPGTENRLSLDDLEVGKSYIRFFSFIKEVPENPEPDVTYGHFVIMFLVNIVE